MADEVKMKGDSLQVQFDDTGDHFILLWRDKWGRVHITGPGTFHSADLVVLNVPPKPPSPPAEVPDCKDCSGIGRIKDGAGPTDWVTCPNCHGEGKFQYPAGVPEVDIDPVIDGTPGSGAPIVAGRCRKWYQRTGKKPAGSCEGCTTTCKAKGQQESE